MSSDSNRDFACLDRVVKLNIGGKKFITSFSTLTNSGPNFFTGLLSNSIESTKLDDYYFIDRDPNAFQPLLNYLRTGELILPPQMEYKTVKIEAEFYGINIPDENKKKEEYEFGTLQFESLISAITSRGKECRNQMLYFTTKESSKAIGAVPESEMNKFLELHKSKLLCKCLEQLTNEGWEIVPGPTQRDLYLLQRIKQL